MNGQHTSGADEHLQLNEFTVWQGGRTSRLNPQAHNAVPRIRQLLLESKGSDGLKIGAAEELAEESMIAIPPGMPGYSTLGDLYLRTAGDTYVTEYRRELDMDTGVLRTTYVSQQFAIRARSSLPRQIG